MVMAEPENLVHFSCAVVYDLLRRVLWEDEEDFVHDVEE